MRLSVVHQWGGFVDCLVRGSKVVIEFKAVLGMLAQRDIMHALNPVAKQPSCITNLESYSNRRPADGKRFMLQDFADGTNLASNKLRVLCPCVCSPKCRSTQRCNYLPEEQGLIALRHHSLMEPSWHNSLMLVYIGRRFGRACSPLCARDAAVVPGLCCDAANAVMPL